MRFLFVHQNFPGQYLHILRSLVAEGGHDIVFLSNPNRNRMNGVGLVHYDFDASPNQTTHPDATDFDVAMRRAQAAASAARVLKDRGFVPDIVVGHQGWGELLGVQDVYPGVPVLGYMEFYYRPSGFDMGFDPEFQPPVNAASLRARNAVNHLAMAEEAGAWGQTPTEFQLSSYPASQRDRILLIREGVDLTQCAPDPSCRAREVVISCGDGASTLRLDPKDKVVTYLARGLEPYRGFHVLMRMLPDLLGARRDVRVVVVGDDRSCYGPRLADRTWKEHFVRELDGKYDASRVHFVGLLNGGEHLRLLQRSDAHVYLTYPFVASWSLREALACGTPLVCSDTAPVREFVQHGCNGILGSFFDPAGMARKVLDLLEDPWLDGHLRAGARAFAERHLRMDDYIASYRREIARVSGQSSLPASLPVRIAA